MSNDRIIVKENMRNAISRNYEEVVSAQQQEKFLASLPEILDASNKSRRKPRKTYRVALAITCSAAVLTLAITAGMLDITEPMTQNIGGGQQVTDGQDENGGKTTTKETITTPTEQSVQEQSDIAHVEKGEIVLSGGEELTNYTNPTKIVLKKADIKDDACRWSIKNYTNNKKVYSGKGTVITKQLSQMISQGEDGSYIISFTYTDNKGNKIIVNDGFAITTKSDIGVSEE